MEVKNNFDDLTRLMASAGANIAKMTSDEMSAFIKYLEKQRKITAANEMKEIKKKKEEEQRRIKEEQERKREQHIEAVTSMDLSLDWENAYANEDISNIYAESVADGFIIFLNNLGRVDIEYIAQITGESCKTVIETLKGSIYQNPEKWGECFYKGWETSEEYLSGNIYKKLLAAKKANEEYNGYFEDNVKALQSVMPNPVDVSQIYVTLLMLFCLKI